MWRISHHAEVYTTSMRDLYGTNSIAETRDLLGRILDILNSEDETSVNICHFFGNKSSSEYELNPQILRSYFVPRKRAHFWNES